MGQSLLIQLLLTCVLTNYFAYTLHIVLFHRANSEKADDSIEKVKEHLAVWELLITLQQC